MAELGYKSVPYMSTGPLKLAVLQLTRASTNDTVDLQPLFSALYAARFFFVDGLGDMPVVISGTTVVVDVSDVVLRSGWLVVLGADV